jgi:hypothetical protein
MTQTEWVLKEGQRRWITPLDAFIGCGCLRLAARVLDLRRDGYIVDRKIINQRGKHFAAYKVRKKHGLRQH